MICVTCFSFNVPNVAVKMRTNQLKIDPQVSSGKVANRMQGKKIVITGASGGIGFWIAKSCLEEGAKVGACYLRSKDRLLSLVEKYPCGLETLRFNVCSVNSVKKVLGDYLERIKGCDILVHCAGVGGKPQFLVNGDPSLAKQIFAVNLMGCFHVMQQAIKCMMRQKNGKIVNIGSISSVAPTPGVSAYAASKGGVEALTRSIAVEYGRRGIFACCLRLGPVNTGMIHSLPIEAKNELAKRMPNGEMISPDLVASKVLELLQMNFTSELNGQTIDLSGGFVMDNLPKIDSNHLTEAHK